MGLRASLGLSIGVLAAAVLAIGAGSVLAQPPAPAAPGAAPRPATAATEAGFGIFQTRCLGCHGNPAYERAPSPNVLREISPERIYESLTTGVMKTIVGDSLSDAQRRTVSESIAGRILGSAGKGDAASMANRCTAAWPARYAPQGGWPAWGVDGANTRNQSLKAGGLAAVDIPKLKLKWAFGLPQSTSSYSQPAVAGGRLFVGADTGYVYALDAKTGCVQWSFLAKAGVRATPVIGKAGTTPAVFVGDLRAYVYALDARTGKLLWSLKVEDNFTQRVTASPTLYRDRLYVPISEWEEFSAGNLDYGCCTAVGGIAALDTATGKMVWKTYVMDRPQPTRKNSKGVQQYAPAGGAVWNTPAIDPIRNAVYFGTGDATTYPAAGTSDSIMALDMASGRVLWSTQVHGNDSFLGGCNGTAATKSDNCPQVQGPDWDIPAPVILTRQPSGQRMVLVSTKPGDVLALDPDKGGKVIWRVHTSGGAPLGDGPGRAGGQQFGMLWGGALDGSTVYYGLTDGGVAALNVADGKRVWLNRLGSAPGRTVNNGSPGTGVPGALLIGGGDGKVHALDKKTGDELWVTETAKPFDTVNKVPAKGGSISSFGPVVADGMLYIGSGYAVIGGQPGNVLLAYGK